MKKDIVYLNPEEYTGKCFYDGSLEKYFYNLEDWKETLYDDIEESVKLNYCEFNLASIEEEIPDFLLGCNESYPNINLDFHYLLEDAFSDEEEYYTDEWLRIYKDPIDKLLKAFDVFNKEKQEMDLNNKGLPLYNYNVDIRINIDKSKLAQEIYNQLLKYKKHG